MKLDIDIQAKYETLKVIIQNNQLDEHVTDLIKKLEEQKGHLINGKKQDSYYPLSHKDIVCFYSMGSKIYADTLTDTYEVKEKLYQLEDKLQSEGFIRLSKYAIGNTKMILKIDVEFNGSLVIQFKNQKTEGISRRNLSKVKKALGL